MELKDYRFTNIIKDLRKSCFRANYNFIGKKLIYHHYQSGYRKNHSTATLLAKLRGAIKKAMKASEITLAVFIDYSKAFDTIDFSVLIKKMHTLNFSKRFLYWIFSYLTDARPFAQIDSNIYNILDTNFRVPQGSILGPALFKLCVADMKNILNGSECIQYADDSTIYRNCKIKYINKCSNKIESDLNAVEVWSKGTNLVFNPNKTKVMVIPSRQMAQYHQLGGSNKVNIKCNNKNIAIVKEYKLLGIILDEHFELHSHVNKILKDGYSTSRTLKLLKRYAPYYLRKQLWKSLILSKLDYCNIFFKTLPQYQKNRMEKLLQSCAGFVKCKYGCKNDVIDLKWLLLEERIDSSILKLVHNGIKK